MLLLSKICWGFHQIIYTKYFVIYFLPIVKVRFNESSLNVLVIYHLVYRGIFPRHYIIVLASMHCPDS